MRRTELEEVDVRQELARATAPAHEALHVHPWVRQLAAPVLPRNVYCRILTAYLIVHENVEHRRNAAGLPEVLSLAPAIAALKSDLGPSVMPYNALPRHPEPAACVLGALYVLHGAGFGARTLETRVAQSLPDAPRSYLSQGTSPTLWRHVKSALQRLVDNPAAQADLHRGATEAFELVGRTVTLICERGTPSPPKPPVRAALH